MVLKNSIPWSRRLLSDVILNPELGERLTIVLPRLKKRRGRRGGPRHGELDLVLSSSHDIVDRQQASGLENAMHLSAESVLVRDVHPNVKQRRPLEAAIGNGQIKGTADAEVGLAIEPYKLCEARRDRDVLGCQVDARDPAAILSGEEARRSSKPGANVQQ